jgi:DNA-binding PadR family transcriptional regulator
VLSKLVFAALLVSCSWSQAQPKMSPKKCAAEVRAQLLENPDVIRRELLFNTDLVTYTTPKITPLQFWVMTIILEREEQVTNTSAIDANFRWRGFNIEEDRLISAIERMERGGKLLERVDHPTISGTTYRVSVLGEWERANCLEFYRRLLKTAEKVRSQQGGVALQSKIDKLNRPHSIIPRFGHTQAVLLSFLSSRQWTTAKELWLLTEEYNTPTDISSLYTTLAELKRLGFLQSEEVSVGLNQDGSTKYLKAYRTSQTGEDALARSFFFYTVLGELGEE